MLVIAASVAVAVALLTATVIAVASFGPWWDTNNDTSSEMANDPSFRRSKYAHAQVRNVQESLATRRNLYIPRTF